MHSAAPRACQGDAVSVRGACAARLYSSPQGIALPKSKTVNRHLMTAKRRHSELLLIQPSMSLFSCSAAWRVCYRSLPFAFGDEKGTS